MSKQRFGPSSSLSLRKLSSGGWVFVHPRAVRDRAEDLEEVQAMIEAEEYDVAIDELRWLLSGCHDFMAAHVLLGELAIEVDNDLPLARGHFGHAYQLGLRTLKRNRCRGPLPGTQPANAPFYAAAYGLTLCLEKKGSPRMADEVAQQSRKLDPADPARIAEMLDELRSGGTPIVSLSPPRG